MYICVCLGHLLYSRNWHSTVNQLYLKKNSRVKLKPNWSIPPLHSSHRPSHMFLLQGKRWGSIHSPSPLHTCSWFLRENLSENSSLMNVSSQASEDINGCQEPPPPKKTLSSKQPHRRAHVRTKALLSCSKVTPHSVKTLLLCLIFDSSHLLPRFAHRRTRFNFFI